MDTIFNLKRPNNILCWAVESPEYKGLLYFVEQ